MRSVGFIAAAAVAAAVLASGAHATAIPGLYNSGVTDTGTKAGDTVDQTVNTVTGALGGG